MATKKKVEDVKVETVVEEQKTAYVAAQDFRDIETKRVYRKGEVYENDNPDRIKALSTKANKSGQVLIKQQ